MLNSIQKVVNASLNVSILLSEHRQYSIFFALDFHYGIGNFFNENIIIKHLFNLFYNKVFYPIFLDCFLITTTVLFNTNTFVITIYG